MGNSAGRSRRDTGEPVAAAHTPDDVDWIGRTREEPIDPHRRIIDAHHHLYEAGSRKDPYRIDELLVHTRAGHNVTDVVFVEANTGYRQDGDVALRPVGETAFVESQARISQSRATRISAIVAFADFKVSERLGEILDAHSLASGGRLRGIRYPTAWDASPEVPNGRGASLLRPSRGIMREGWLRRGITMLGERGYLFEAYLFHTQIAELARLARTVEATSVVLDHMGMPIRIGPYHDREATRAVWKEGLKQLAACPNVTIKLGGMGMDPSYFGAGWATWQQPPTSTDVVAYWGDDLRWCIDTFGPSRCMFESNYPVDRRTLDYTLLWNAFQMVAADYTKGEQDDMFCQTAARVYRID